MNDPLEQKLNALHAANQPDAAFTDQLEQQLRLTYEKNAAPIAIVQQNGRFQLRRRLLGIAASVVIISGLFAAIPPLRSLAQEIIDFFVPSEEYTNFADQTSYEDIVTVATVRDAEKIAGFEALEWLDDNYQPLHISAGNAFISIAYERKNDRGPMIAITKYATGTRPEQESVGEDANVQLINVRGVQGQFVKGAWVHQRNDATPVWDTEFGQRLYWQEDGMSYYLYVVLPEVRIAPEVVAIAEELQENYESVGVIDFATIEEAEDYADFEALQLLDDNFDILNVFASEQYIQIKYERAKPNPRAAYISVTTSRPDTSPPFPVGIDAEITEVVVNGAAGQFVSGEWLCSGEACDAGDYDWKEGWSSRLAWQQSGMVYSLEVTPWFAETAEAMVAIAEALE